MTKYSNQFRIAHNFKLCDQVWLFTTNIKLQDGITTRKLRPKYCGLFKIFREITPVKFILDISEQMKNRKSHDT